MKKILFCLGLVGISVGAIYAAGRNFTIYSDIGPAVSTSNVLIAAPGAGKYNCITDITVISASTYTFRMLNGATTAYSVLMPASGGLIKEWGVDNAFCVAVNTTTQITVDNGTFSINYQGFVRQ